MSATRGTDKDTDVAPEEEVRRAKVRAAVYSDKARLATIRGIKQTASRTLLYGRHYGGDKAVHPRGHHTSDMLEYLAFRVVEVFSPYTFFEIQPVDLTYVIERLHLIDYNDESDPRIRQLYEMIGKRDVHAAWVFAMSVDPMDRQTFMAYTNRQIALVAGTADARERMRYQNEFTNISSDAMRTLQVYLSKGPEYNNLMERSIRIEDAMIEARERVRREILLQGITDEDEEDALFELMSGPAIRRAYEEAFAIEASRGGASMSAVPPSADIVTRADADEKDQIGSLNELIAQVRLDRDQSRPGARK